MTRSMLAPNIFRLARTWVSCLHSIKLNTQDGKKSIVKSETAFSFAYKIEVSRWTTSSF